MMINKTRIMMTHLAFGIVPDGGRRAPASY